MIKKKYISNSWPPERQSTLSGCLPQSGALISSSRTRGCQYDNRSEGVGRAKTLPSPPTLRLYQRVPSSHSTSPGQTAIKTSAPPAKGGLVRADRRSINLIFIHSPLAATHRRAGSRGVDLRGPPRLL